MINKVRAMLVVFAFAALFISMATLAQAKRAPADNAVAVVAVMDVAVAPVVLTSVPPMTAGYDVILNFAQAAQSISADTSARRGLSATVDWRGQHRSSPSSSYPAPEPELVLRA